MKRTKLESPLQINDNSIVTVTEMGNITEIMENPRKSKGGFITKLDRDHYVDNRTGEYKEFEHIENRSQDLNNIAKSLKELRDIINTNVTEVKNCRWMTFTYAENMQDPYKLYNDFHNTVKRLRRIYGFFEYIEAVEPQGRGAWHIHAIFVFDHKAPYMAHDVVQNAWKRGWVTVKALDDIDNVGAYLTAYLGDLELSGGSEGIPESKIKTVEFEDSDGNKAQKRYIKGGRLHLYPAGMHLYRCSRGIKKPEKIEMPYKEAKRKVCSAKQTYASSVYLQDDDSGFENILTYEYYNSKR